jgi:hypothetical protein
MHNFILSQSALLCANAPREGHMAQLKLPRKQELIAEDKTTEMLNQWREDVAAAKLKYFKHHTGEDTCPETREP